MKRNICKVLTTAVVVMGLLLVCAGLVNAGDSANVINPSFQVDHPAYPGYCSLTGWTGSGWSVGVSPQGVFWDNGTADQNQVGFIQNTYSLSQTLTGLQAGKQYWLQYYYNAHAADNQARGISNSTPTVNMFASYDGTNILSTPVSPVQDSGVYNQPFNFANVSFTTTSSTGTIAIGVSSNANDGNSLVIDGVSVIQRDANEVVMMNPSFEASGLTSGWMYNMIGWDAHWTAAGVCHNGEAFADNGTPDGQDVAFIQGSAHFSQTILGLEAGKTYKLSYGYNCRQGTATAGLKVLLGSSIVQDEILAPVTGTNSYDQYTYYFVSDGSSQLLDFSQTLSGDHTCLIDNVSISQVVPEPSSILILLFGVSGLVLRRRK